MNLLSDTSENWILLYRKFEIELVPNWTLYPDRLVTMVLEGTLYILLGKKSKHHYHTATNMVPAAATCLQDMLE